MSSNESRFGKPPPGYIPGYGRGAVGFFTRSDIGPARSKIEDGLANPRNEENENADMSEIKYDKWSGYEGGLFTTGEYDEEDKDADFQYNQIDNYMEERRKTRKEKNYKEFIRKNKIEKPTIKQQFFDLKKDLSSLRADDWEKIPDIENRTIKKKKLERFTPVTDKIIEEGLKDNTNLNSINPAASGTMSSLVDLREAKDSVLGYVYDTMSNKVSGQTSVNPIGYLTDLNSIKINSATDIADFKKARDLLKSIINSNPKSVSGWIAAARIEELDGKLMEARNIICQAATVILDSEDIWLETARLHPPESAKSILAQGLTYIPNSVRLWLQAANLEHDVKNKSKILKKALEQIPGSEQLWKSAIELENEEVAKAMLYKAVECVPTSVDFWLALARLEIYENARNILNKARKANPSNYIIWIHAAKLEEANTGLFARVEELVERAFKSLKKHNINIPNETWIREAENCEQGGSSLTCVSIIKTAIKNDENDNEEEKKQIWTGFANDVKTRGCIETCRSIFTTLTDLYPNSIELWFEFIDIEKNYGTKKELDSILKRAVEKCSDDEIFWLMYAKHVWNTESAESAKQILKQGLEYHKDSERIYLAIAKLDRESNDYNSARNTLNEAMKLNSRKIWKSLIQLEREINFYVDDTMLKIDPIELCTQAIEKYPEYSRLFLTKAELKIEKESFDEAIKIYENGIETNKKNANLFIALAKLYKMLDKEGHARSIYERGLKNITKSEKLWYEFILFEYNNSKFSNANVLLSKALKEFPNSGLIWSLAIDIEKLNKHAVAAEALNKCERDDKVMISVAKMYANENHIEKARKWFENSIRINSQNGDIWINYYKLEKDYDGNFDEIVKRCTEANPTSGDIWKLVTKKIENAKLKTEEILKKAIEFLID